MGAERRKENTVRKEYEKAELEVVNFSEDIILTSQITTAEPT